MTESAEPGTPEACSLPHTLLQDCHHHTSEAIRLLSTSFSGSQSHVPVYSAAPVQMVLRTNGQDTLLQGKFPHSLHDRISEERCPDYNISVSDDPDPDVHKIRPVHSLRLGSSDRLHMVPIHFLTVPW